MTGTITVNGAPIEISFDATATLLDVLRDNGHTEVKSWGLMQNTFA